MTRQEKVMNLMGVTREKCPGQGDPCPKMARGTCTGHLSIWKAIDDPETGEPVDSLECDACGLFLTVREKTPIEFREEES